MITEDQGYLYFTHSLHISKERLYRAVGARILMDLRDLTC